MISAFDLFKIGVGPSSSHTVGPMAAARAFRDHVALLNGVAHVEVEIFGSLAWTGKGHGTDLALCLGLLGHEPATVDPDKMADYVAALRRARRLDGALSHVAFDPDRDVIFQFKELLPFHTNGMRFRAYDAAGRLLDEQVRYSIGGGFVAAGPEAAGEDVAYPLPFESGAELLRLCAESGRTMAELQFANELARRTRSEAEAGLDGIAAAMFDCIDRGMRQDGVLPGGLKVRRRAKKLHETLEQRSTVNSRPPHEIVDWVSLYALAVNEENAAGGRVVTAPTNGAAGIVPAVLRYCRDFCPGWSPERGREFLLTAAAIGGLIKRRASISGAEVGCQGEVGSAAAMAAAGLTAALGGTPEQIENAAEIAMEHHLGMTCDPIGGLVQIPCIERNAFGANKAIVAASLSLRGDGVHRVTLDEVIETMRQTGADMQAKYKETSQGGLAVNVAAC
ncbi:L-serine dehydratase [Methylopila jiangsuensis]|uniref:L-serine dehydratase n=1 Tax=Methylopila jiangsuensis TaxID=586230 RepID=A0A9W6JI44_9HYPH|nr:L-serine ammonia-lyase [Methylopila jiangsuensis]MDR6284248.1 L-serine dehydratase [Methylopila jiangsuensis]GLK76235.1 L-serine dehydratase [Methylopila jiangsuensis]